ncbi:hypothetical protein [Anaerorhabdus sp.]|uniref:hypothetical protein n=1 Tax=Anaerorhabdus sp. TaxID=1872524 RepID=UPI002FCA202A
MAKFSFFNSFKKQEEVKPSDIQIEIEEKEKNIEKLEHELEHSGDFLNGVQKVQNIEYNARKKQVNQAKRDIEKAMDDIDAESGEIQEKINVLATKSEKAAKEVNKKKAVILSDADKKNKILKEQLAKKEKEIYDEIQSIKQSQDKLFLKERNRLIQETEEIKESLKSASAIECEKKKKEIKKLETHIEKLKKNFDKKVIELENSLSEALKNEEITYEGYKQEIENTKENNLAQLEHKKQELATKINQWAASFDDFALSNQAFIDGKKAELDLLDKHEKSLKDLLKQKIEKYEVIRRNLEDNQLARIKELENSHNHAQNELAGKQNQFRILSDTYKKEVENFTNLRATEQEQTQQLIEKLGREFEQFQQDIVLKTNGLDTKLKEEADSIYEFYRGLLASEEEKLNGNISFLKEDLRRDEEKLQLGKKELEAKELTLESTHYQRLNEIKDRILKCQTDIKNAEIEHNNYLIKLSAQFESDVLLIQEQLKEQEAVFAQKRVEIDEQVEGYIKNLENKQVEVNLIQQNNDEEVNRLENQIKLIKEEHSTEIDNKNEIIEGLKKEIELLNEKMIPLEALREEERSKHEACVLAFEARREELISAHTAKIDESKDKFQKKMEEFEQKVLAKKDEMQAKYEENIKEIQKEHKERVAELQRNSDVFIEQISNEIHDTQNKINTIIPEFEKQIEQENRILAETGKNFDSLKEKNANELESFKHNNDKKLNKIKENAQTTVEKIVKSIDEHRKNAEERISEINSEISRLTDEEKTLITNMAVLQEEYEANKNDLIKKNSVALEEHLQQINDFEHAIDNKRIEIRNIDANLRDIISHYKSDEQDENQKLIKLRNELATELNEQAQEVERSIAQLEVQKDERIDYLRSEYELARKTISNKMNSELIDIQRNMEDEKNRILQEQSVLEATYANKVRENEQALSKIQEQVKLVTQEMEKTEESHKNEMALLQEDFEHHKAQLEYEAEVARESNIKNFNELKDELSAQLNQVEIEKIQLKNAVDAKIRQQETKKEMIEKFIADYERNNKIHMEDREREISNYQSMVDRLNANIEELQNELDQTKQINEQKIQEIKNAQEDVDKEITHIIAMRNENYQKAIEQVNTQHEQLIQEFIREQDEKQEVIALQNDEILNGFIKNYEDYKAQLAKQLADKQADINEYVRQEEEKLEAEKTRFEALVNRLNNEEAKRIEERDIEKENFKKFWDESLSAIRQRIKLSAEKMQEEEKAIRNQYNPEINRLINENESLKKQEEQVSQSIHDLEEKLEQRKFQDEQRLRKYEEECEQNLVNIENLIKDRQAKIDSYKQSIDLEVERFVQTRNQEEEKLQAIRQSKLELLEEEKAKINDVIDKQQKIFEKLSEKKKASIEEENRKNNKILEKELQRIEKEKEAAGEEFELSLDELDKQIREKEERYEKLLNEQIVKNEAYIQEYKDALRKRQNNEENYDAAEFENVSNIRDELMENEKHAKDEFTDRIAATKNSFLEEIYSLQDDNNKVLRRFNALKKKYESLDEIYKSNSSSVSYADVLEGYEDKIIARKNRLSELEAEESKLRKEKAGKIANQSEIYDEMVRKHQKLLNDIEQEIASEQHRLIEFENEMSEKRRLDKELEIKNKNLFAKKLDYLRQKMFDN